ncbi:hemerythrin domain-containing protein [Piscinibacter sakaiensis]|uniref:Hemerythrin-like domain-containing protein n=1 Tax=Piscinibacter sakaiensis TaxID=1547922 RepID=A0A0K8NW43_PISS1|nr:hemerythrin domain-containing protein [Piscinibacter sakaiensis]GAP34509.1 hypothetical protein ISF6_4684 [Piscinibacter sakaiensis]
MTFDDDPVPPTLHAHVPALDAVEVLDACHRSTLAMLKQLHALNLGLHAGAEPDDAGRGRLAEIVRFFQETGRPHHEDEERHVFPRLRATADAAMQHILDRLQEDHRWLDEDWAALMPRLRALAVGGAAADAEERPLLAREIDAFVLLSIEHIALEESCIYPALRERLVGLERRLVGREMVERHRAYHRQLRRIGGGAA